MSVERVGTGGCFIHKRSTLNLVYYSYATYFIAADIISCIEFSHDGELLATGDKGGRVVIFQRDQSVSSINRRS